jgi:hypothetical protein
VGRAIARAKRGGAARKPARSKDRRSRSLAPLPHQTAKPLSPLFETASAIQARARVVSAISRTGGLVRETAGFDVLPRDRAERTTVGRILIFRPAVEHVGPATVHRFLQFLCDRFKLRLAGGASSLLKAEAGGAERHDFCGSFFFPLGDEARLCWPSDRKFVVNPEYAAKTISRFVLSTSACVMS